MSEGNGPEGAVGCICIAWLLVAGSGTALKAQDATGSAPVSEAKISLRQAVSTSPPAVPHSLAPHSNTDPAPGAEHRMRRRSERASLRIAAVAGDEDEPSLLRYSLYGAGIGAAVGAGVGAWAVATADVLMLPPAFVFAHTVPAGALVGTLGGLYAYGLATYEEEEEDDDDRDG